METIVGTAGWSIPAGVADQFPEQGSTLERYAARFAGVEINSSFHRPHRASTWQRWADTAPGGFRFAVKMPRTISHERKLADCPDAVERFLGEVAPLGAKLGALLLQLPPKLAFDAALATSFLEHLVPRLSTALVCEPRHPSWFEAEADALLARFRVARAAADPAVTPKAGSPGGWRGLSYWRLHGSPVMYRSAYDGDRLDRYAALIRAEIEEARPAWCMFDNTASSAATGDALGLMRRL